MIQKRRAAVTKQRAIRKGTGRRFKKLIKISPLEKKANAIAELASKEYQEGKAINIGIRVTGHPGRELFLSFLRHRGEKKLNKAWADLYPDIEERKRQYLSTMGKEYFELQLNAINEWLEGYKRPNLRLTKEELLNIIFG